MFLNNNIKSLYQLDIGDRTKNFQKFLYFKYYINVNIVKLISLTFYSRLRL